MENEVKTHLLANSLLISLLAFFWNTLDGKILYYVLL